MNKAKRERKIIEYEIIKLNSVYTRSRVNEICLIMENLGIICSNIHNNYSAYSLTKLKNELADIKTQLIAINTYIKEIEEVL